MCGIVGAFTTNHRTTTNRVGAFFQQALYCDTLRGFDSTGIALKSDKMDTPVVYKRALAAPDFLQLKQTNKLMDSFKDDWSFMLGHNRAATKGGIGDLQAHPFQFGDITLVHNGTLNNHRMLKEGHQFDVDSEAVAFHINMQGVHEVVKTIRGAFTLVFHDASDDSLNFVRNEERPLWIGVGKENDTLLMASEAGMLQWLAFRNGIELGKVYQANPGTLYKYWIGSSKDWAKEPVREVLELAPKYQTTAYSGGRSTQTTTTATTNNKTLTQQVVEAAGLTYNRKGSNKVLFQAQMWCPTVSQGHYGKISGRIVGKPNKGFVNMTNSSRDIYGKLMNKWIIATIISAYWEKGDKNSPILQVSSESSQYRVFDSLVEAEAVIKKEQEESDSAIAKKSSSNGNSSIIDGATCDAKNPAEDGVAGTYVMGPFNALVPIKEFNNLTRHGCSYCCADISADEAEEVTWVDSQTPVCKWCALDDAVFDKKQVH